MRIKHKFSMNIICTSKNSWAYQKNIYPIFIIIYNTKLAYLKIVSILISLNEIINGHF